MVIFSASSHWDWNAKHTEGALVLNQSHLTWTWFLICCTDSKVLVTFGVFIKVFFLTAYWLKFPVFRLCWALGFTAFETFRGVFAPLLHRMRQSRSKSYNDGVLLSFPCVFCLFNGLGWTREEYGATKCVSEAHELSRNWVFVELNWPLLSDSRKEKAASWIWTENAAFNVKYLLRLQKFLWTHEKSFTLLDARLKLPFAACFWNPTEPVLLIALKKAR